MRLLLWSPSRCQAFWKPSCKKHRPRIRSCCLRVGQRLLQPQRPCPRKADLCPERWTSGRWRWLAEEGPGWLRCTSGCECCTDAEGHQRFRHQAGTETSSGSAVLRGGDSVSQELAFYEQVSHRRLWLLGLYTHAAQIRWNTNKIVPLFQTTCCTASDNTDIRHFLLIIYIHLWKHAG